MYTMHYPFGLWLPVMGLALTALLLPSVVSLAFMAFTVTGEALTPRDRLVARMGRPLVLLGVFAAVVLLAACAALAWAALMPQSIHPPWRGAFVGLAFMLFHGAIMGVMVLAIWQRMVSATRRRTLLFCLGLIWFAAVLCGLLLAAFPVVRLYALHELLQPGLNDLDLTLAAAGQLLRMAGPFDFAAVLAAFLGLSLTGSGMLGLVWLLLRRSHDDFGRDYYIHTVRFCASRAALGSWLLLVAYVLFLPLLLHRMSTLPELPAFLEQMLGGGAAWGGWLVVRLGSDPLAWFGNSLKLYPLLPLLLSLFVLPVLAALFFGRAAKAAVPLRHKLSMLLGMLSVLVTVWGMTLLFCLLV